MSNTNESIAWDNVTKKEARGATDDSDFGEVQEVGHHYVLTQKGMVSKEKYYIPKYLVQGFDSDTLWFNASENDLQGWKRDSPPDYNEYNRYKTSEEVPADVETRIPLIEERLNVSNRTSTTQSTITKEPVTEKKTIEVPVTHEELVVEKRPPKDSSSPEGPVKSKTEIKVPLMREEVEVTKEQFVKEEIVLKKKAITETRTVSDTVTSETIDMSATTTGQQTTTGRKNSPDDD